MRRAWELIFSDCAAVTNTTNVVATCPSLFNLVMPNLTRGLNMAGSAMGNYGMNNFANSIGTAAESTEYYSNRNSIWGIAYSIGCDRIGYPFSDDRQRIHRSELSHVVQRHTTDKPRLVDGIGTP
jgi:hypothetical protein